MLDFFLYIFDISERKFQRHVSIQANMFLILVVSVYSAIPVDILMSTYYNIFLLVSGPIIKSPLCITPFSVVILCLISLYSLLSLGQLLHKFLILQTILFTAELCRAYVVILSINKTSVSIQYFLESKI